MAGFSKPAFKQSKVFIVFFLMLSFSFGACAKKDHSLNLLIEDDKPGAEISRYIYGHFAEHLGRSIYEGIWVGEKSSIANTNGYRNDVLAALKALKIPVVRWPGGCFADEYHWRDGIGPREKRPVRINNNWGGVEENNAFGTHEFLNLMEMIGADAYIAGNVGSGTPQEMAAWLEYMTSPKNTTLANLRRKNGRDKPWKVEFFGVGNESWGCGGHMRPEYYADLYNQFSSFLRSAGGHPPKKVASGGHSNLTVWTDILSSRVKAGIDGISHHYYTLPTSNWDKKGQAVGFPEKEWISTFSNTLEIEDHIKANIAVLEINDPDGKLGLYLDEWGTWYDPKEGTNPTPLYQQNSLRDALLAGLNFNIFHRYSKRIHMANIAQTVNVLQAMILTDKEKMVTTPSYHAFSMYQPFQDSTYIPSKFKKMTTYQHQGFTVPSVSVSTARSKNGDLTLALVNLHPDQEKVINIKSTAKKYSSAMGRVLTGDKIDSHNTFSKTDNVVPAAYSAQSSNGKLTLSLPAKSLVVVTLK